MYEEVSLDLAKIDLFGWEPRKSDLIVKEIVRLLESGFRFPKVKILKINETAYSLDDRPNTYSRSGNPPGGHHRAIAHFKANKPLECLIVGEREELFSDAINIRDIKIEKDELMPPGERFGLYSLHYNLKNENKLLCKGYTKSKVC